MAEINLNRSVITINVNRLKSIWLKVQQKSIQLKDRLRLDDKPKSIALHQTQPKHKDIKKLKINGWKDIPTNVKQKKACMANEIL